MQTFRQQNVIAYNAALCSCVKGREARAFAFQLLKELARNLMQPTVVTFNALLAFGTPDSPLVLQSLKQLQHYHIQPNLITYSEAARVCEIFVVQCSINWAFFCLKTTYRFLFGKVW